MSKLTSVITNCLFFGGIGLILFTLFMINIYLGLAITGLTMIIVGAAMNDLNKTNGSKHIRNIDRKDTRGKNP